MHIVPYGGCQIVRQPVPAEVAQAATRYRESLRLQHAADRVEPGLLFARSEPRGAADLDIDVFPTMMAHNIRLGHSLADRNDRDLKPVVFVEGENHGVYGAPEHRVHHPGFEIGPLNPSDRSVVIDPEQDATTLEFDAGVLAVCNQLEQLGFGHQSSNPDFSLLPRQGGANPCLPSRRWR